MSEELNEAIAWLTEHIDMREHVRSERAHEPRKHLDAITAARARIAELEAQLAEADRSAGRIARESGRVRRELDDMKEAESRRESWRRSIKARWGVSDRVSLDDVFEEALQNKSALLATQWALCDIDDSIEAEMRVYSHDPVEFQRVLAAARAAVAQADGKEAAK